MLFLPQMNVWIYPKAPTFCHKFPTFFLLFSYFFFTSEAPIFLLLFHMKSLESLKTSTLANSIIKLCHAEKMSCGMCRSQ